VILVGLGNPGERYADTRHNVGFLVVDRLAEAWGAPAFRTKFQGQLTQVDRRSGGESRRIGLLKPMTFMNLSGQSVQGAAAFFKAAPADVVVVHDELDLPLGRVALKAGGGSAGHNGLKSITQCLGSSDYRRLRLGIGRPGPEFKGDIADFVLEGVPPSEKPAYESMLAKATEALELLVEQGFDAAMNRTNRRE
jgi:peptidyl-tRNA hydrolase, PTH1 family